MEKKMTKKEMFAKLREMVADNPEMVKFIDHEVELLERKNASKSGKLTPAQVANEGYKEKILEFLADHGASTVTTINTYCNCWYYLCNHIRCKPSSC